MSPAPLVIVLSSYNGCRYIAEQIESIQRQTLSDWTLFVRDDGSSDDTIRIVEALAALDGRIQLLQDDRGNVGPAASFGILLEHARDIGARYVALSDQDDVWKEEKLARQLEALRAHESAAGPAAPLLIHSDLAVVGHDLRTIHDSFLAYQGLAPQPAWPLGTLLIQNFVTGCTVVMNRPLLEAALPLPTVIMHDWWLALCAAALGKVIYLAESTVLYRQHEKNVQGSRGWRAALVHTVRRPLAWWSGSALMFRRSVQQADELRSRVERESAYAPVNRSLEVLQEFCSAFTTGGPLARLRAVYRHRIRPRTLLPYPAAFYLRVILWRFPAAGSRPASHDNPETDGVTRRAPARDTTPYQGCQ